MNLKFEKVYRLFTDNDRRQLMAKKRIFVNKASIASQNELISKLK